MNIYSNDFAALQLRGSMSFQGRLLLLKRVLTLPYLPLTTFSVFFSAKDSLSLQSFIN